MDITTETLQTFLDDAWDAAPDAANTLRDQLRTFEKAATNLFRQGSLSSVSKNSASQSYRGPGLGSYTPVQISNAWRTLINIFDSVKDALDFAGGTGIQVDDQTIQGDSDPQVYAGMKSQLRIVDSCQTDMTQLRLPNTLAPEVTAW